MLKIQNKLSIFVFIGIAIIVIILYVVLFFVAKGKNKVPKLPLPNPANFPEGFNDSFKSKDSFAAVDKTVFDKTVDLSKLKKLVIKKSDKLYKNIKIFCNDDAKDIDFYFVNDTTKEQFFSNLNYYNFTFYFYLPRGKVNKYVIDIPNYNAAIKADNSVLFIRKFSLYNVGLNVLNDNKDYETITRDSLKKSFTKMNIPSGSKGSQDSGLYLWYSLFTYPTSNITI